MPEKEFKWKQKYLTIPLAIAYWFIPVAGMGGGALDGYYILGAFLSIGALSDLDK